MKFRKKPIVVEAEQFLGVQPLPFTDDGACCYDGKRWYVTNSDGKKVQIVVGDWVIREFDGQGFYPCENAMFRKLYEPIDSPAPKPEPAPHPQFPDDDGDGYPDVIIGNG